MLAYAPERRTRGASTRSTQTLTFVVVGHILLVGVALTTKMTIDRYRPDPPPILIPIPPDPLPPPPNPVDRDKPSKPISNPTPDHFPPTKPTDTGIRTDQNPPLPPGQTVGTGTETGPITIIDPPKPVPVRIAARFNTPDSMLRPPYPTDKLRMEEETTLRLRLTVDANGRVTAVDPVGNADKSFLEAARPHIIRAWRYKPATVDGVATGSTVVISLSFRLEDA